MFSPKRVGRTPFPPKMIRNIPRQISFNPISREPSTFGYHQFAIATSNFLKRRNAMNRPRQFPAPARIVLSACALFILALAAQASDRRGAFSEEFHQTYAFTP